MIYLDSGRILPRSQWEARHTVEYSSEGPSEDTDGKSLKIIVARRPKREVGHLAIGVRKMNLAFPNVRAQGSRADIMLDPDIVVDTVLRDVEDGSATGLERDVATRIPNRGAAPVTTSKRLALRVPCPSGQRSEVFRL